MIALTAIPAEQRVFILQCLQNDVISEDEARTMLFSGAEPRTKTPAKKPVTK